MQRADLIQSYSNLMRLDRPIGTLLLLWPTLWALWLASGGWPSWSILFIFIAGVFLMRSAGCIVNDFADRHVDAYVQRTASRPLATGQIQPAHALILAAILSGVALLLVWQCNRLTVLLAFMGAGLTVFYPYMKRFTHLPQLGLGVAFSWGIPMAFAALTNQVPLSAWYLFVSASIWPVIYDTLYAMVDRPDDLKIGIRSTAILFQAHDRMIIGVLQVVFVLMMVGVGILFQLHAIYYLSLLVVCFLFAYQQWLIYQREPSACFQAFLHNHWVGFVIFMGIFLDTVL